MNPMSLLPLYSRPTQAPKCPKKEYWRHLQTPSPWTTLLPFMPPILGEKIGELGIQWFAFFLQSQGVA